MRQGLDEAEMAVALARFDDLLNNDHDEDDGIRDPHQPRHNDRAPVEGRIEEPPHVVEPLQAEHEHEEHHIDGDRHCEGDPNQDSLDQADLQFLHGMCDAGNHADGQQSQGQAGIACGAGKIPSVGDETTTDAHGQKLGPLFFCHRTLPSMMLAECQALNTVSK